MHIPRIKGAQIKGALHNLKSACVVKEQAAKKMLPGIILCAQSLAIPVQAPGIAKLIKPLEKDVFVNSSTKFRQIKNMITGIIPQVSDEFITGIIETSDLVKCNPEDLTALLFKESRFNPKARNGNFGGIGQMNKTSLKLSIQQADINENAKKGIRPIILDKFLSLPREEQIPYVRNYILAMKKTYIKDMDKPLSGGELYGLFYTPGRIKKTFLTSAQDPTTAKMYYSNRALDYNKDSQITITDLQKILNDIKSYDLKAHLAKK